MESIQPKQQNLIEFIGRDSLFESPENRLQLIRILSRSSTLPKVQKINIVPLNEEPNKFIIQPAKSLKIGTNILTNPVLALIYIRYGLEWQIWYRSQPKNKIDPRLCDIAASQVASKFYDTLSQADKREILDFPKEFLSIFRKFKTAEGLPEFSKEDYEVLGRKHQIPYPTHPLKKEDLQIIRYLAFPLEYLLMSGGDKRLKIDRNRLLNKYGCTPFPRPKAFTFASSTATSISNIAFNQSEKKREKFIKASFKYGYNESLKEFSEGIKSRIKKTLALPKETAVFLSPSGTDVSLIFAGLCQSLFDKPLVHILVASDETGSGVPAALQGHHFSDRTSQGVKVTKGHPIKGFEPVDLIQITLRNSKGELKTAQEIDLEVKQAFETVTNHGQQPILHVMNQSKLGYVAPSKTCLKDLEKKYNEDFFALIDNSQMRMGRKELRDYIERDYAVTITGSKFFTGPPFSGALILPKSREHLLGCSEDTIPEGLIDYAYKNNFPPHWKSVKNLKEGSNPGTLMRWYAAIVEQNRYFETPVLLRSLGTEMFCSHVENNLIRSPFLESITLNEKNTEEVSLEGTNRSIFPFFIFHENRVLSHEEMTTIYQLLNQKLSGLLEQTGENNDNGLLADQVCHIGQPVKAVYKDGTPSAVLRISLGARVISESWKEQDVSLFFQKIEDQMSQVDTIIRKIEFILNHPQWWRD
ncbi:MAG TPA: hypothetical protein VK021_05515 [Flavobacteriaceae bacterium]|nr:hypothetical protein [Flavobacteriaceae bacterium]